MSVSAVNLPSSPAQWSYVDTGATRDLRIDFMRGLVFVLLFVSHFNYFSWFSLLAWERVGVVSSAETFIILAGVVTGMVYGKRLQADGLGAVTVKLMRRAWTLYKIAVFVAASIALLRFVPGLNTTELTHFTDPVTGRAFPLYPPLQDKVLTFFHVLMLRATPHQFQVVALYVALFLLTPIMFWAIGRGRTGTLLLLSWICYGINFFAPETEVGVARFRLTGAQFEYGFPLLAWQLIFVHGVVAGVYKKQLIAWFSTPPGRLLLWACVVISILLALFSLNHPLPQLPDWAVMHFMPAGDFQWWYSHYFLKYQLGPGRVLNNVCLLVAVFALLTVAWKPLERALGWFFIPLGQESMYVFIMHIYLILLVSNTPLPAMHSAALNTAIHAAALFVCWVMIKTRFLFNIVPR